MRKALIGIILAATAMTPVAAWAQDDSESQQISGNRRAAQQERFEQRQQRREQPSEARVERQEQRSEPRVERREHRFERRQARQEPQVQAPADQQVRAFNRRGERNLNRAGIRTDEQDRREWQNRGEWRDGRDGRRDWRDGRRDWRDGRRDWRRDWNRTAWRNDRRYDWQSWRYRNRSLFRSPYYSPFRNHRYSRFSIGLFLEPLFYSQRYWLNDPFQYRLPYAPPGTQWVRYYNDVLLVDVYSGEVIDVIYDFFW